MAEYHGNAGSVSMGGNAVGEVQDWRVAINMPAADASAMGDDWGHSISSVRATWSGAVRAWLDGANTAQAAMIAKLTGGTISGTAVTCVFTISSGKTYTGQAIITDAEVTSDKDGIVEITFAVVNSTSLTAAWA